MKVAVLVSGGGTNLQAIIDAKAAGRLPAAERERIYAVVEVLVEQAGKA